MSMFKALFIGLCVVLIASQIEGCADKRSDCVIWKNLGKCHGSLKGVMEVYCKKTCNLCDALCVDRKTSCTGYKKMNQCGNKTLMPWLKLNCRLTCGFCTASSATAPQLPTLPKGMGKL